MSNILIFGNSASGKSTLAKSLCETHGFAHLDLDSIAWEATTPPKRKSIDAAIKEINHFIKANDSWVVEGCYTDLLALIEIYASEVIFMNLPIKSCISNARLRPWEPHKYASKEAQDENLDMLINWISEYETREGVFSMDAHQEFYSHYKGKKRMISSNMKYV